MRVCAHVLMLVRCPVRYGELVMLWVPRTCVAAPEGAVAELSCGDDNPGHVITDVRHSFYGVPPDGGWAGCARPDSALPARWLASHNAGKCSAAAAQVVRDRCVGRHSCNVAVSQANLGLSPCQSYASGSVGPPVLFATVTCAPRGGAFNTSVDRTAPPLSASRGQLSMVVAQPPFTLEGWVAQYPFDEATPAFQSSSTMLNRVWDLCLYTLRASALDTFTDSNTRERLPCTCIVTV